MNWNFIMGIISSIALFFPVLLILVLRLGSYRSFPVLLIYYVIVLAYNLMKEGYIQPDADILYAWGISNNLLDAPLMLMFLSYFSSSAAYSRRLTYLIIAFIVFEIIVVLLTGFNVEAITIVLGPGLFIVFALSLYIFIRQSKIAITYHKGVGKTLMAASFVFAYGCYAILYALFYVFKTNQVADTFLLYFIVVTFSSIILCTGLFFERKRIQKLTELKKTRKELHDVYKDSKPTTPFRAAMLDFDREPWN